MVKVFEPKQKTDRTFFLNPVYSIHYLPRYILCG